MSTITLSHQTQQQLERLAGTTGKTPDAIIQEALSAYLEDLEDLSAARQELERIEHGEGQTRSLSDVKRRLGLDD